LINTQKRKVRSDLFVTLLIIRVNIETAINFSHSQPCSSFRSSELEMTMFFL